MLSFFCPLYYLFQLCCRLFFFPHKGRVTLSLLRYPWQSHLMETFVSPSLQCPLRYVNILTKSSDQNTPIFEWLLFSLSVELTKHTHTNTSFNGVNYCFEVFLWYLLWYYLGWTIKQGICISPTWTCVLMENEAICRTSGLDAFTEPELPIAKCFAAPGLATPKQATSFVCHLTNSPSCQHRTSFATHCPHTPALYSSPLSWKWFVLT